MRNGTIVAHRRVGRCTHRDATLASATIGHTIPIANSVNAKTPTATRASSPVTLPAATP